MKEVSRPKRKAKFTYDFEGNLIEIDTKLKSSENPVQITKIRLKTQGSAEKQESRRVKMKSNRLKKSTGKRKNNFMKKKRVSFLRDGNAFERVIQSSNVCKTEWPSSIS